MIVWNGMYYEDENGDVVDFDLSLDEIWAQVDEDEYR